MNHESGCADYSLAGFVKFLDQNAWLSGTILLIIGVMIGMFGRKFFPWVTAAFATFATFVILMLLFSVLGWLGQTWSVVILVIVAAAIAGAAGYFIKVTLVWGIAIIGIFAGLVFGCWIYSILLAITKYDALWLFIVLAVLSAGAGGFLSFKYKGNFLSLATAFLGGYCFMRGLTYYFGAYPSEMEMWQKMVSGQDVELGWQVWLYYAFFILCSVGFYCW